MGDKSTGLRQKYHVEKIVESGNGLGYQPVNGQVFVLKPDTDPIAKIALKAYAEEAAKRGYEPLAEDIFNWLGEI